MADINSLYQQVFGRAADAEGAAYWQNQLNSGLSEADLAKALYGSDEYKNDINAVYQQNFGRDADTAGLQYWQDAAYKNNADLNALSQFVTGGAQTEDRSAMADGAKYPVAWDQSLDPNNSNIKYDAVNDKWVLANPTTAAPEKVDWQKQGMAGDFRSLNDGDWEALQKSIYDSSTAGLARQEELARAGANQSMSNRGIWSSGIAERAQNDITGQLGATYQQAGANAANTRYQLQNSDNQAYNSYNLSNQSLGNQYDLGKESNANSLALGQGQLALGNLTQNDNYAINRANLMNNAAAQQSQAQWQAQWEPATYLAGLWNGTGGVISNGSGSNFSI